MRKLILLLLLASCSAEVAPLEEDYYFTGYDQRNNTATLRLSKVSDSVLIGALSIDRDSLFMFVHVTDFDPVRGAVLAMISH